MEKPKKFKLREIFAKLSPILINPSPTSITIGLSKRFLIFQMLGKLTKRIEDDPYLNFISVLKNYKVLGKILDGTLYELHRDRNKLYFKNFFIDRDLYETVKQDIEWVYHKCEKSKGLSDKKKKIKLTITKRGVIVYDNYKKNNFNLLLMTIHSGTWVPKNIQKKMKIMPEDRYLEEDIYTNRLYSRLVLEKGGIWIDNKQSRFACDFNRTLSRAIYQDGSEMWIDNLWVEKLDEGEIKQLHDSYHQFYFTLANLVDTYHFNIIFDGHSMKDGKGRANISFGVKPTPKFYMPVVLFMRKKLKQLGYENVELNQPYTGSYIIRWLKSKFPQVFIFSAEINKKLYMSEDRKKVIKYKAEKLAKDITQIFDIDLETEEI